MSTSDISQHDAEPPLVVGQWWCGDEYATDVVICVSRQSGEFVVRAVDRHDDEAAEILDVSWDGEVLAFAAHWASTGRFVKYKLQAVSQNRLSLTYTYTQQEQWHRLSDESNKEETK